MLFAEKELRRERRNRNSSLDNRQGNTASHGLISRQPRVNTEAPNVDSSRFMFGGGQIQRKPQVQADDPSCEDIMNRYFERIADDIQGRYEGQIHCEHLADLSGPLGALLMELQEQVRLHHHAEEGTNCCSDLYKIEVSNKGLPAYVTPAPKPAPEQKKEKPRKQEPPPVEIELPEQENSIWDWDPFDDGLEPWERPSRPQEDKKKEKKEKEPEKPDPCDTPVNQTYEDGMGPQDYHTSFGQISRSINVIDKGTLEFRFYLAHADNHPGCLM